MGLLSDKPSNLNELRNFIRNPFQASVDRPFRGEDFPEGFLIEEVNGAKEKVRLVGNMMPMVPFSFGGEQRIKKDYYAGHSEPVTQVLGPQESDVTIKGMLKDTRYDNEAYYGVSTEIQQQIDAIRIRGNLCRFVLGEWERYGYIQKTDFKMRKLSRVGYEITFLIVGFNAPTNARFLQKQKLIPFDINKELIDAATILAEQFDQIPDSVPQSIGDLINGFTDDVSRQINKVTGLVDQVIQTTGDVKKSIGRILGLLKHTQGKIRGYKNFLGQQDPFDPAKFFSSGTLGRYTESRYFASSIVGLSFLAALLNRYRDQFKAIADATPLGRHYVRQGDNLQKISLKFYGNSDSWKEIYDFNNLSSTELEIGKILEVPRI